MIADIVIWQATNGLLLIPAIISLLIVLRRIFGRRAFTDKDWFFLNGERRQRVFSLHVWLRVAVLWLVVVLTGVVQGYVLLPVAVSAIIGAGFLAALVAKRVALKWLA